MGPAGQKGDTGLQGPKGDTGPSAAEVVRPAASAFAIASQTVAGGDSADVTLGGESLDVGGDLHTAAHPEQLIAPKDGIYSVEGAACWAPSAAGSRQIQLRMDSASGPAASSWAARSRVAPAGSSDVTCQSATALVPMTAGSDVRMLATQTSGGALDLLGVEQGTHLSMVWVGPLA